MLSSVFIKIFSLPVEDKSEDVQSQFAESQKELVQPLVTGRQIAVASVAGGYSCEFGSLKYFILCGFGGSLACGGTHIVTIPLDIVKCRMQVNPTKYKNLVDAFRVTVMEDGNIGLVRGWAPTLFGYSIQGFCKFGLYEVFKVVYGNIIGEENSYLYRTWLYLFASATAEFIGDIPLAPMEAAKVKMQTTSGFARTLREAVPKMMAEEGYYAFYKPLVPLWLRQVPYTVTKFVCFERTIELLYKYVVPKPRDQCTKLEQLVITFTAGYIAGIFCAIVSHPPDTVVSRLSQEKGMTALQVAKKIGMAGLWRGLTVRIIMIGTISALQWFTYDGWKVFWRLPRPPPPQMPESLRKKLEGKQK